MTPFHDDNNTRGAGVSAAECCARVLAGAVFLGTVLAGMANTPVLVFDLSLFAVYLAHTVLLGRDPVYYLAARLRIADHVQVWEYLVASAALVIIVKGGHVHGALSVLMFASYAAFLAVAALFNRDGSDRRRGRRADVIDPLDAEFARPATIQVPRRRRAARPR